MTFYKTIIYGKLFIFENVPVGICMQCGEPASRTQRLIDGRPANFDDPVIVVGASELYEARCRRHHIVGH